MKNSETSQFSGIQGSPPHHHPDILAGKTCLGRVFLSSSAHTQALRDAYEFDELRTTAPARHTTNRNTTSKLANIHYAKALAERESAKGSGVKIIPVHPGMVVTNLDQESTGIFFRPFLFTAVKLFATPVEKGALLQIYAAVSPDAKSGIYYGPVGKGKQGSKHARDAGLQEELFK
ncbi:hypothetical protein BDW69DRAFT_188895 [Aspergillus filifer]